MSCGGEGVTKRVIEQTLNTELPEGFQTAEFMLEHGFIDRIVHRKDLRSEIARIVD
jgi:acetyl-CoA carboxylase carboxyl transferase subunit beta